MGASSGLTPKMGVAEQENFYGVDGDCRACPGISSSPPRSTTISDCACPSKYYGVNGECLVCPGVSVSPKGTKKFDDCECPVSTRIRALLHAHTPVRIICTQRDRVFFSRIAPPA